MSKCVSTKHKSSRGNLLNISGALEAVMQPSDFRQFSTCMIYKSCYLRKKPIFTNYRLQFIHDSSRNNSMTLLWCNYGQDICLLGEINFPSIESAGYEETWWTCHEHPGSIPALLIASCYLHTEAKYLVFWGQISLCKVSSTLSTVPWGSQPPFHRNGPLKHDGKAYNWKGEWKKVFTGFVWQGFG